MTTRIHLATLALAAAALGPSDAQATADRPVRTAAEWEPTLGLLFAWPLALPEELVVEIAKDDRLYVLVEDDAARAAAAGRFAELGIDPEVVDYVPARGGEVLYCASDWGPLAVFDGAKPFQLADTRFVGYGWAEPADGDEYHDLFGGRAGEMVEACDAATASVAKALGHDLLDVGEILCPGNLLVDGAGSAFTTRIMLQENEDHGVAAEDFLAAVDRELGLSRFHVLPNFEPAGVQHITCLMKPLDTERVLVTRVPEDHAGHGLIEALVAELAELETVHGEPWEVLRIDAPALGPDNPAFGTGGNLANFFAYYIDAIVLNDKVLVPLYGFPEDAAALATWREVMPGYQVHGFEHPKEVTYLYPNTILCRTVHVWDPGMLYLRHARVKGPVEPAAAWSIEALVRSYSGAAPNEGEPRVVWRVEGETEWRSAPLAATDRPDVFAGSIDGEGIESGSVVQYWIAASDASGRSETLPPPAPRGWFSFRVEAETTD